MKTISERIKEGLQLQDMKQTDLVNLTGITKGALSSYISGAYEPKQRNIYKIAKALNVNEAWLMGYDVPKERESSNNTNLNDKATILLNSFNKLNDEGKDEAIKRVDELTELSKYKKETNNKVVELPNKDDEYAKTLEARRKAEQYFKENPHLMPIASHDKEGEFTEEDYKHDMDIMMNDDLWK